MHRIIPHRISILAVDLYRFIKCVNNLRLAAELEDKTGTM